MFIIFLDIDGVLNTEQSYFYWHISKEFPPRKNPDLFTAERLCPVAISNLNLVLKTIPEIRVVISSTWRISYSLENLQEILVEDGFRYPERIIGMTPSLRRYLSGYAKRGDEIQSWLEEYTGEPKVEDWVAIDDHVYNIDPAHLIQTPQEIGFTICQAYEIIERFNKEWKRPLFLM